jgi:DNA-directed RNA polymerase subunit RPC12/RpoP
VVLSEYSRRLINCINCGGQIVSKERSTAK